MGNCKGPKGKCSRQMLLAIKKWVSSRYGSSKLEEITICLVDKEALRNFKEQFLDIFGNLPYSQKQRSQTDTEKLSESKKSELSPRHSDRNTNESGKES